MKNYQFSYEVAGEQLTIATFKGNNKKEARQHALRYKRLGLLTDYPKVKLNKVKVV